MEQNVLKSEENVFLESKHPNTSSKQILEEELQNKLEPDCGLKQNAKIPLHVIESCVSHGSHQFLTEEICQYISDFCSYKLREVIKSASNFMKFSGRSKLTMEDFMQGLYANEEVLLLESKLSCIGEIDRENTDNLNHNVDLDCMNNCENSKLTTADPNQMLFVNVKEFESKVSPCKKGTKRKRKNRKCNFEKKFKPNNVFISRKWLNGNPFSKDIGNVSPELKKYFNVVTKFLLSKNEMSCLKIIHDFKSNRSILNLVPYLVHFFSLNLNNLNHDYLRMSIFLKALHSLLSNSYLYLNLKILSNELAQTILKFLVSDIPFSNYDWDYWLLKDTAAYLLTEIVNRSESKELFLEIVYSLKSTFRDFQKSLESHYGAIVALNSLGVPAIMLAISPYIIDFSKYMNTVYESNIEKRHNINMIQGQLIHSYYVLIHHCFKYEFFNSYTLNVQDYRYFSFYYLNFLKNRKVFPFLSQLRLGDIYGDRLVHYFPLTNFVSYNVNYSRKKLSLKLPLHEESSLQEPSPTSVESPLTVSKSTLIKHAKKHVSHLNLRKKRFSLKNDSEEKDSSHISKVCNFKRLCTKNSFKESREQIFEIVPLKKHTIKFGKFVSNSY